jgi:hypothetical protein
MVISTINLVMHLNKSPIGVSGNLVDLLPSRRPSQAREVFRFPPDEGPFTRIAVRLDVSWAKLSCNLVNGQTPIRPLDRQRILLRCLGGWSRLLGCRPGSRCGFHGRVLQGIDQVPCFFAAQSLALEDLPCLLDLPGVEVLRDGIQSVFWVVGEVSKLLTFVPHRYPDVAAFQVMRPDGEAPCLAADVIRMVFGNLKIVNRRHLTLVAHGLDRATPLKRRRWSK